MKKKIRKPLNFGVQNDITGFGFSINKAEGVIDFLPPGASNSEQANSADMIWFEPKTARWLADKLLKAAMYLEQEND